MFEISAKFMIIILGLHFLIIDFAAMIKMFKIFVDEIKQDNYSIALCYSLGFWVCFFVFVCLAYALFIISTKGGF